jgi:hypothetical protein
MSSLAGILGATPKVDTPIDAQKAAQAVVNEALSGTPLSGTTLSGTPSAIPKPSLSDTKVMSVTGNPVDNDSLVKLTTDVADMKALLEGVDKRMKEGFAALLLKVTGGKPVDESETEPHSYVEAGLPTRANVAAQALQEGGRGTRRRKVSKKKRTRASRK